MAFEPNQLVDFKNFRLSPFEINRDLGMSDLVDVDLTKVECV
jgi:hypothetical protein